MASVSGNSRGDYLQCATVEGDIDGVETVRITAYVLQRIRLFRLSFETQLSRCRILASHVPGKALIDALLLGIERVYVQLVAANVACVGTVEQRAIVIPRQLRRGIALGAARQLGRQTHIAQLHGQRVYDSWRTRNDHTKCLPIAGRGAKVIALMQCLTNIGDLQRDAIIAQLRERIVRMLQPPVYRHVVGHSATLQQQLATAGHIDGGILKGGQQLCCQRGPVAAGGVHVHAIDAHLPHELAMATVRVLVLGNASAKEKE